MPGLLRSAVERWFNDVFQPDDGPGWWSRVKARWSEFKALWVRAEDRHKGFAFLYSVQLTFDMIVYALTGWDQKLQMVRWLAGDPEINLSAEVAALLRKASDNPTVSEIVEIMGALVTEPVLALLEREITHPSDDPKDFARAFHGMMISLNTVGGLLDTALETLTGGQVEGAGRLMQSMYWSLGLGFLGWQTLAPLLESGLQPGLDRYYKRMARPARFSVSELRDLHALGVITTDQLREEARTLGWRDEDIDQWINLAYRTLSQGEIWDAYHQGKISRDEAVRRLRALGYDPDDIPLLFDLNPAPAERQERDTAVGTARQAYREGLISETELRDILSAARYGEREIGLIIAIEASRRTTQNRALTVSQLKAAWEENVITTPEARHWLAQSGFDPPEIDVLIATWEAQAVPEYRKLNVGTIVAAYVAGILSRAQTKERLQSVGLAPEDADIEIALAEARNPDAFGRLPPAAARKLSAAQLAEIYYAGLINEAQYRDKLIAIGYAADDADLILQAAHRNRPGAARELPQRSIERAYVAGALIRSQAAAELAKIGFSEGQIEIILDTLDREEAATIAAPEAERSKTLSPAVLEDLLIAGLITADEMQRRLIMVGYSSADADLLTRRAAQLASPPPRMLNQSLIERAYLAGVLTRQQIIDRLIALEYPADEAERIVRIIEAENPAAFTPGLVQSIRTPSIADLTKAVQNNILTPDEFLLRAQEIGFAPADAQTYLAVAAKQERKGVKSLSPSQIVNAYGKGIFSWYTALHRLTSQGYSEADATVLLRMERDAVNRTDAWLRMLSGNLDPYSTIAQLLADGYTDADIINAFDDLDENILDRLGVNVRDIKLALAQIPGGEGA